MARKKYTDPADKLPKALYKYIELFNEIIADKLPPYRDGVNYKVNLLKNDKGRDLSVL